jgi:hypothetical protein
MAMNLVQFQKGVSMGEFMIRFGTEEKCQAYVEKARWPRGYCCPICQYTGYSIVWHGKVKTFQCGTCRHQTTLGSGTIFEHTKLPFQKWFQAIFFLTQSKNNVSALELTRLLGVCYRTAWRLKHKLTQVMLEREEKRVLSGVIQLDDAYLGGECSDGKAGRGSENKVPFLAAVQTNEDGNPLYAVYSRVNTFSNRDVANWTERKIKIGSTVVTDGLACFNALSEVGCIHNKVVVGQKRKSSDLKCFRWINTILGNLKTAITGTYHAFDFMKYADRYLAEVQYRFNRRSEMAEMLDRLLYASIQTGARPEKWLRLAEA